jgi:hypothetical protein
MFLAYAVADSAAMNSGGRYLVPMDWVLYFYYGLAILSILQFVHKVLSGVGHPRPTSQRSVPAPRISDKCSLGFLLAGIVTLASFIPIANLALPALSVSTRDQPLVEAAGKNISSQEAPGVNIVYGVILYPYYNSNGTMSLDFLTPVVTQTYKIVRILSPTVKLKGGENGFIALTSDEQGIPQVKSIYLWQDGVPVLIWKIQP